MTGTPAVPTLAGCTDGEECPARPPARVTDEVKKAVAWRRGVAGGASAAPSRLRWGALWLAAALTVPSPARAGERSHPSNFDLLRRAGEAAVAGAVDSLAETLPRKLALQAVREDSTRLFWEALLVEKLTREGFEVVRLDPPLRPKPGPPAGAPAAASGTTLPAPPADTVAAPAADTTAAPSDSAAAAASSAAGAGAPAAPLRAADPGYRGPRLRFESESLGFAFPSGHGGWIFGGGKVDRLATAGVLLTLQADGESGVTSTSRGSGSADDRVPEKELARLRVPPIPMAVPDWKGNFIFHRIGEPALVTGIVGGLVYLFYANRSD